MSDSELGDLPDFSSSSLVEQVYGEVRKRLFDGRLPPGSSVPDSVLAKQMGVSRAPVRDALNRLVQDGLLTKRQNYPYEVRRYTASDMTELNMIRWGYESVAARQLVYQDLPLTGFEHAMRGMDRALETGDIALSLREDMAFHAAFVASANLPELTRLHGLIVERILSVPIPPDVPDFVLSRQRARHLELVDALRKSQSVGEPDEIIRCLSRHILTYRAEDEDEVVTWRTVPDDHVEQASKGDA